MMNDILPIVAGKLIPSIMSKGDDNAVYLTFDDGPDPIITPKLCDKLTDLNCPATFFITTSRASAERLLIIKQYDLGFTIGSHCHNHKSLMLSGRKRVHKEIRQSVQILEEIAGTRPSLFRPPFGRCSFNMIRACSQEKLKIVLWSLSAYDWKPSAPGVLSERIVNRASTGDIILLHDCGLGAETTLKAIPAIVNGLRDKGFTLRALPEYRPDHV